MYPTAGTRVVRNTKHTQRFDHRPDAYRVSNSKSRSMHLMPQRLNHCLWFKFLRVRPSKADQRHSQHFDRSLVPSTSTRSDRRIASSSKYKRYLNTSITDSLLSAIMKSDRIQQHVQETHTPNLNTSLKGSLPVLHAHSNIILTAK